MMNPARRHQHQPHGPTLGMRKWIALGIALTLAAGCATAAWTARSRASAAVARLHLGQELAVKLIRRDTEDLGRSLPSIGEAETDAIGELFFRHDSAGYSMNRPAHREPAARLEVPTTGLFGAALDIPGDLEFVILNREGQALNQVWKERSPLRPLREAILRALTARTVVGSLVITEDGRSARAIPGFTDSLRTGPLAYATLAEIPHTNLVVATLTPGRGVRGLLTFPLVMLGSLAVAWLFAALGAFEALARSGRDLVEWVDDAFCHFHYGREIIPPAVEGYAHVTDRVAAHLASARLKSRAFADRELDPSLRWLTWNGFLRRTLQQYRAGSPYHALLAIRFDDIADPIGLGRILVASDRLRDWSVLGYSDEVAIVAGPVLGHEAASRLLTSFVKEAVRARVLNVAGFRARAIVDTMRDAQTALEKAAALVGELRAEDVPTSLFDAHLTIAPPVSRPADPEKSLSGSDLLAANSDWVRSAPAKATPPPFRGFPAAAAAATARVPEVVLPASGASARLRAGAALFHHGREHEAMTAWKEAIALSLHAETDGAGPTRPLIGH